MNKIVFRGHILAEQPVAILPPETDGAEMPVFTETGERAMTGYIPSTTLRGKLRRHAFQPVMEKRRDTGGTSLDEYYFTVLGQTAESEEAKEYADLLGLRERRARNPVASLFGAGMVLNSRLAVGHAVPARPVALETLHFARTDLSREPEALDLLDEPSRRQWVDRALANAERAKLEQQMRSQLGKLRSEGADDAAVSTARTEFEARIDAQVAAAHSGVSIKQILSHRVLPQGTRCNHEMVVRDGTPAELGALLQGLDGWSRDPYVGGQNARGCGRVSGRWEVMRQDDAGLRVLGSIETGGDAALKWTPADEDGAQWYATARAAYAAMLEDLAKFHFGPERPAKPAANVARK